MANQLGCLGSPVTAPVYATVGRYRRVGRRGCSLPACMGGMVLAGQARGSPGARGRPGGARRGCGAPGGCSVPWCHCQHLPHKHLCHLLGRKRQTSKKIKEAPSLKKHIMKHEQHTTKLKRLYYKIQKSFNTFHMCVDSCPPCTNK